MATFSSFPACACILTQNLSFAVCWHPSVESDEGVLADKTEVSGLHISPRLEASLGHGSVHLGVFSLTLPGSICGATLWTTWDTWSHGQWLRNYTPSCKLKDPRNETLVHQQLSLHQLHHPHPSQRLMKRFFRLRDVTHSIYVRNAYKIIATCIERYRASCYYARYACNARVIL